MEIRTETIAILENKPGTLARLARALGERGINIEGFMIHEAIDHGIVRMVTSDPKKAAHVLGEAGVLAFEVEVVLVPLPNRAGALGDLTERLAGAKVNVDYAYGTAGSAGKDAALVLRVSDAKKALAALRG
jgi:hypothetical protein